MEGITKSNFTIRDAGDGEVIVIFRNGLGRVYMARFEEDDELVQHMLQNENPSWRYMSELIKMVKRYEKIQ